MGLIKNIGQAKSKPIWFCLRLTDFKPRQLFQVDSMNHQYSLIKLFELADLKTWSL